MTNNTPDYTDNLAFDPAALNPCNEGKRGSDVLMATLMKCQAIVGKNVELEKKLKIAEQTMFDVGFWLSGFVASLNNECSEHNRSLPIGNFEQAIKTQADALRQALKKIKE